MILLFEKSLLKERMYHLGVSESFEQDALAVQPKKKKNNGICLMSLIYYNFVIDVLTKGLSNTPSCNEVSESSRFSEMQLQRIFTSCFTYECFISIGQNSRYDGNARFVDRSNALKFLHLIE